MASKTMNFTSKGIIGEILLMMESLMVGSWAERISLFTQSNEETEYYSWFGNVPRMALKGEGSPNAATLRQFEHSIRNADYAAAIVILTEWIRRDKTAQIERKIAELAASPNDHWQELLAALMIAGESTACYDGQFFYDTDHSEGDSGTLSNDIEVDISAVPAAVHGSTTAPSPEEIRSACFAAIVQMYGFKDDRGRHVNQSARQFTLTVPLTFWEAAATAINATTLGGGDTNMMGNLSIGDQRVAIELFPVPLLSDWTEQLAVHITGGQAFVRQEEVAPHIKAKAEGSDFEYDNDAWEFAARATRAVGYGQWRHSCLVTLV